MRALVCVVFSLLTTASLYQPPTSLVLREGGGESASFASLELCARYTPAAGARLGSAGRALSPEGAI